MPDEIQIPTLPEVKIIRDGKQVDTSAIDDYDSFMSVLILASIAANTAKTRKHFEDRTSKGKIFTFPLNITENSQEVRCPYPCQSLYLENNGPGQIFIAINALDGTATPIPATRAVYFPFETHVIERFYIWSAAGTVATAIAILKY